MHVAPVVFVLESNQEIGKIFVELLTDDFDVELFSTLGAFRNKLNSPTTVDLIVTELTLSDADTDDISFCVKGALPQTPVLIVSKVDGLQSIQAGLKSWANDYLTKPFNNHELLSRCQRLTEAESLYTFDSMHMTVIRRGCVSEALTSAEFRLLTLLAKSDSHRVSMALANETIWGTEVSSQRMHTLLSRLRPKVRGLDLQLEVSKDGMVTVMST